MLREGLITRNARWRAIAHRNDTRANRALGRVVHLIGRVWFGIIFVQAVWPTCAGTALSFAVATVQVELASANRGELAEWISRPARNLTSGLGFVIAGLMLQPWLALAAVAIYSATLGGNITVIPVPFHCLWEFFAVVALAPLFEERLYRGQLQPLLRKRYGSHSAIVVTSIVFALPHIHPLRITGSFLAGLVLGAIATRTGRTSPCVFMHIGFNVAAIWQQLSPEVA